MKSQRRFDTRAAQLEAVTIRKMIDDLNRSVVLLGCDIAAEEERTGISERSHPAYSIVAGILAGRSNNLKDTIIALEHRLSGLDQAEQVAELV
jgi:hypothetical protein